MLCPKCKSSISDNVLRCPKCNLKVRIICPHCKSVNIMGQKTCKNCGYMFFINCPICNTVNLSESEFCRKCAEPLKPREPEEPQNEVIEELTAEINNYNESPDINENADDFKEQKVLTPYIKTPEDDIIIEKFTENEDFGNNLNDEQEITYVDNLSDEIKNINSEENETEITPETESESLTETVLETENGTESEIEIVSELPSDEPQKTEDDFLISSDNIDITDEQVKDLFDKVDEIEKNKERKKEAEALIQKKFEKQEEIITENEEEIPPEYVQLNQQDAQIAVIEAIQNPMKKIISLNGKEGYGKTLIIRYVREALRKENYIWAMGECNALTQITPFGYLQDVLLNLFNLSNFCSNIEDFIKNNTKVLEAQFYNLNAKEINDLLNFLYPYKSSEFNGILKRKDYTTNIIKKVFESMAVKSLVIFVVDDFENIDGASFDFLKNLLEDEKLREKIKLLITNKYNKISQGYFYNKDLDHNNYSNIFLAGLENNQCVDLINSLFGQEINIPDNVKEQIFENAKGTSAYIEQACFLLNEAGIIKKGENDKIEYDDKYVNYILPKNTYRILEERINILEKNNSMPVTALYYACLLGNKFSIHQFENVLQFFKLTKEDFKQLCDFLINTNYLIPLSENYLTFSNTLVWHYLYERAKTEENYITYNNNIYMCVQDLTLSNNSLKPLLLQNSNNKKEAYLEWSKNVELSSYLGDTNLYIISLKQLIKIADNHSGLMSAQERITVLERMGKILYKLNPKEAISYLSASIAYYKESENYSPIKIIELSGFLVQACKKSGDYFGIIESCDAAVEALKDEQHSIEKAIIISKKLKALLYLGNCEEVITLAKTEIIDVMENALAKANSSNIISDEIIFNAWVDTCLNLAYAYAIKGDRKSLEVLSKLDNIINLNKIDNVKYLQQIMITKAFNHTMRGEIKLSADILIRIKSKYSTDEMDEEYILEWNFINIINKIISKDFQNITDEMFKVATFADNIDDGFTKNMLKLLLGYVIRVKSKKAEKALDIYNEEIVYFSKEKIATGALLCWLLISEASMQSKGVDFALDVALKALDVAKGPKVNNYIFIIALKQLIAKIYLLKQDFEASKMYLEKAMAIAKQNDLKFMQMLLYRDFGKYFEEMISLNKDEEINLSNKTAQMYKNAIALCKTLMLTEYEAIALKDYTAFKVSCRLKNIEITEEDEGL